MRRHPQAVIATARGAALLAIRGFAATHADLPRCRRYPHVLLAAVLAVGLAACKTTEDAAPRAQAPAGVVGARLGPTGGSTVTGVASFRPFEGGVTIAAEIASLAGVGRYRVAVHENGNCSSPNGFSAGAPVLLAGTSAPAVVAFSANTEGGASVVARINGLTIDRVGGKAVVVHEGGIGPLDAQPGVRNGRVACGVVGNMQPLF